MNSKPGEEFSLLLLEWTNRNQNLYVPSENFSEAKILLKKNSKLDFFLKTLFFLAKKNSVLIYLLIFGNKEEPIILECDKKLSAELRKTFNSTKSLTGSSNSL